MHIHTMIIYTYMSQYIYIYIYTDIRAITHPQQVPSSNFSLLWTGNTYNITKVYDVNDWLRSAKLFTTLESTFLPDDGAEDGADCIFATWVR